MKSLLLAGVLIIILITFNVMIVKEGYTDSEITTDIGTFKSIKETAVNNTLAIKNMKLNWMEHGKIAALITKYSEPNASVSKKVTYDLTIDQAVEKLKHRRDTND